MESVSSDASLHQVKTLLRILGQQARPYDVTDNILLRARFHQMMHDDAASHDLRKTAAFVYFLCLSPTADHHLIITDHHHFYLDALCVSGHIFAIQHAIKHSCLSHAHAHTRLTHALNHILHLLNSTANNTQHGGDDLKVRILAMESLHSLLDTYATHHQLTLLFCIDAHQTRQRVNAIMHGVIRRFFDDSTLFVQRKVSDSFQLLLFILHKTSSTSTIAILASLMATTLQHSDPKLKFSLLTSMLSIFHAQYMLTQHPHLISEVMASFHEYGLIPRASGFLVHFLMSLLESIHPGNPTSVDNDGMDVEQAWILAWTGEWVQVLKRVGDMQTRLLGTAFLSPLLSRLHKFKRTMLIQRVVTHLLECQDEHGHVHVQTQLMILASATKLIPSLLFQDERDQEGTSSYTALIRRALQSCNEITQVDALVLLLDGDKNSCDIHLVALDIFLQFLGTSLSAEGANQHEMGSVEGWELALTQNDSRARFLAVTRKLFLRIRNTVHVESNRRSGTITTNGPELEVVRRSREFLERVLAVLKGVLYDGAQTYRAYVALCLMNQLLETFCGDADGNDTVESETHVAKVPVTVGLKPAPNTRFTFPFKLDMMEKPLVMACLELQCSRFVHVRAEAAKITSRARSSLSASPEFGTVFDEWKKTGMELAMALNDYENEAGASILVSVSRDKNEVFDEIRAELAQGMDEMQVDSETALKRRNVAGLFMALRVVASDKNVVHAQRYLDVVNLALKCSDCVLPLLCVESPEGHVLETESFHNDVLYSVSWRIIRETALLIECAMEKHFSVFGIEQWLEYGNRLRVMLMTIRHMGAFSALSVPYRKVCELFMRHGYIGVLKESLDEDLEWITKKAGTSITRRSAGLPICITAILAAECGTKVTRHGNRQMLHATVKKLLSVAQCPLAEDQVRNNSTDLPPVHAYNLLRSLLMDSSIGPELTEFTYQYSQLAIEGFTSPAWAIRNCATMLFSTLMNRLFKGGLRDVDFGDFSIKYPKVCEYLFGKVKRASQKMDGSLSHSPPELFPILLILNRLEIKYGTEILMQQEELNEFRACVINCARASSILRVRELAARVWVHFTEPTEINIQAAIHDVLADLNPKMDGNRLHGNLLVLHNVVARFCDPSITKDIQVDMGGENRALLCEATSSSFPKLPAGDLVSGELGRSLLGFKWILDRVDILAACYAKVSCHVFSLREDSTTLLALFDSGEVHLDKILMRRELIRYCFSCLSSSDKICSLLRDDHYEIRTTVLDLLREHTCVENPELVLCLVSNFENKSLPPRERSLALEVLSRVNPELIGTKFGLRLLEHIPILPHSVKLQAIELVGRLLEPHLLSSMLWEFSDENRDCGDRLASSRCIFNIIQVSSPLSSDGILVISRLLIARLLLDDDEEVRHRACAATSLLVSSDHRILSVSTCMKRLATLINSKVADSNDFWVELLEEELSAWTEEKRGRASLLFDHEPANLFKDKIQLMRFLTSLTESKDFCARLPGLVAKKI